MLLPQALILLAEKLQGLLRFMSEALADDLEVLSDKGKDRMFTSASSLLEKINQILVKCCGSPEADAAVRALPSPPPGRCRHLETKAARPRSEHCSPSSCGILLPSPSISAEGSD